MLRRRRVRGATVWEQAELVWMILTAVAMMAARTGKKTITYGELAELMGYDSRAGHTLARPLSLVGQMCLATGLPPINVLVVTQHGRQPGDEVLLRPDSTVAADQEAVLAEDWYAWRPPVAGSFRAEAQKRRAKRFAPRVSTEQRASLGGTPLNRGSGDVKGA
jgi:hypothetical protein